MAGGSTKPLDVGRCLLGDEILISWEDILKALAAHHGPPSKHCRSFFIANKHLFQQTIPSFGIPNASSRSQFDTAVAPINLPTEALQKDAEQIKADALWLSSTENIDEIEALRITLLEWQNRPELRLNSGFADAELASLRDALGAEHAQTLDLTAGGPCSRDDDLFDSDIARRPRILQVLYRSIPSMLAMTRETLQANIHPPDSEREDAEAQWQTFIAAAAQCSVRDAVVETTSAISAILVQLSQEPSWQDIDASFLGQLSIDYTLSRLQTAALLLEILLLRVHAATETILSETMLEWLTFMAEQDHFSSFHSDIPLQQTAIERIQATASFISLALINPAFAMDFVDNPAMSEVQPGQPGIEYFLDADKLEDMQRELMPAALSANSMASPAVLAWGLVFYKIRVMAFHARETREARHIQKAVDQSTSGRRFSTSSAGSLSETIFEHIAQRFRPQNDIEDVLQFMVESAVRGGNVFEQLTTTASIAKTSPVLLRSFQLQILQDLIAAARPALGYTPDIFNVQLTVLSPSRYEREDNGPFKPLVNFVGDGFLRDNFLEVAASRFPYEALPFLRITKLLAQATNDSLFRDDGVHYITHRLQTMESFTQAAVGGFESFHTTHEDENANLVTLDQSVGVLDHRPKRQLTNCNSTRQHDDLQVVPAGAIGSVISDSMPPVIRWQYSYSGLALLGRWLDLHVKGELVIAVSQFEPADDVACALVALLSSLLQTTHKRATRRSTEKVAQQLSQDILDEASSQLEAERDVVDCVFDIIEQQLVSTRRLSPTSGCELLAACVEFVIVLCKIRPFQLWPLLVKSSLFSAYGAKRTIFSVISTVEVPIQIYTLLESCSALLQTVMDLILTISSRSEFSRTTKSRTSPSQRPLAAIVLGLTETMFAAFESLPSWSFRRLAQKQAVVDNLCTAFSNLLYYTFGTGNAHDSDTTITASFRPAADFLLSALSGTGVQSLGSGPIAMNLVSATLGIEPDIFSPNAASHLRSMLLLARTHLGCSRLSGHALKEVNTTLVNLFPIFIRLPLLAEPLLRPSLAIECDIFDAFKAGSTPHLLGHLGSASCLSFLDSLKYLNARAYEEAHISWRLISRLVAADQQWTAIVLITGSPPGKQQSSGSSIKLKTRGKPFLEQALDKLTQIDTLPPTVSVALLKLLQEAQQGWPSVTDAITARQDLFPALIRHISSRSSYDNSNLQQALHNQVAAGVTDLSVISLHAMMAFRDEKKFAMFIPLLKWLTANAIEVNGYNSSLHSNLRKNFAMKYDGLDISTVKRTGILRVPYGDTYFYDLDFSDKILGHDQHWNSGRQSFHAELQRANINLSVVESELTLLRSFKYLCSAHGTFFAKDRDVQQLMAEVITNCLQANTTSLAAEKLFDTLFQSRAEMCGMLLGPLVTIGAHGSSFMSLLRLAYDTARFRNGSYELAMTNNDLTYWRSMLNVLRLAMQFHLSRSKKTVKVDNMSLEVIDPTNSLICEIAAHVIGSGLQSIVAALQEQKQEKPSVIVEDEEVGLVDVVLLFNILQTTLRLPTLPQFATQLGEALISIGTAQSCLLLYSWSHLLLVDNEPVYAPLAARMLATLSGVPIVAEDLAVEGVFNRLATAKVTQRLQNFPQGVGHLDRRPNASFLYAVWSEGFLKIALNLLDAIGGGVAGEVSAFLNQYPQQLSRASLALSANMTKSEGSDGLTLGVACELANLSLLSYILDSFRLAGASSAVDPSQILALADFDEHRRALSADLQDVIGQELRFRLRRLVPTNDTESVWAKKRVRDARKDTAEVILPQSTVLDQKVLKELKDALRCLPTDGDE